MWRGKFEDFLGFFCGFSLIVILIFKLPSNVITIFTSKIVCPPLPLRSQKVKKIILPLCNSLYSSLLHRYKLQVILQNAKTHKLNPKKEFIQKEKTYKMFKPSPPRHQANKMAAPVYYIVFSLHPGHKLSVIL